MTRDAFLFKWFWYAMALLLVWMAEDLVFVHFPPFGVVPLLLPLALVAVAVLEGPVAGAGFGLAVGLLCEIAWLGSRGEAIVLLTLAGVLAGAMAQYRLRQSLAGCLLCSVLVLTLLDLLRVLSRLLAGDAGLLSMLRLFITELSVSLLLCPLVYLLFRKVYDKVGGTKLM